MTDPQDPKRMQVHVCRCIPMRPDLKKCPMVEWYDPRLLFEMGVQVAISGALGTRVDARRLEGLFGDEGRSVHDFSSRDGGEIWFDYAADVGDGFKSTYHIAHLLARPSLMPSGVQAPLPRGAFLVLGGDTVYPTASRDNYEQRLLGPYQEAWDQAYGEHWKPGTPPRDDAQIFVVPGNHDWYDGLVSFTRLFCQNPDLKQRFVGDWKARQGRSYFAIRLPQRWWLWAIDVQLESDIDDSQLQYFSHRAAELLPGDRVILCVAEPTWAASRFHTRVDTNIPLLQKEFIEPRGATVYLSLAGDLHHYRRHEGHVGGELRQKIICGGGGAFLHPTHGSTAEQATLDLPEGQFSLKAAFPDADTSRRLSRGLAFFPRHNPWFGVLVMGVYLALTWGLPGLDRWPEMELSFAALLSLQGYFLREAGPSCWITTILLMLLTFSLAKAQEKPDEPGFRWYGLLHGACHVALAWVLYYSVWIGVQAMLGGDTMLALMSTIFRLGVFGILSGLLGSFLTGFYFLTSLNWFDKHANDAFAGLRIEDYKSFLRFHITADGTLEVYPVGVSKVTEHPCTVVPELIEPVIRIVPVSPPAVDT